MQEKTESLKDEHELYNENCIDSYICCVFDDSSGIKDFYAGKYSGALYPYDDHSGHLFKLCQVSGIASRYWKFWRDNKW